MPSEIKSTMETSTESARPFQFFVKLIDGKTSVLNFTSPHVDTLSIKRHIFEISRIPVPSQRLILSGRQLDDRSVVSWPGSTLHLSLRLPGGKGGFGSLLRGAATKAGQKKTNNFDACRDMSGRRLRHVNAEKKLEEWRAEEEERKLERMAEEFIKKAAKKGKKGSGEGAAADKYVEKYREQSAKCVAQVEECVRDAIGSCGMSKRSVKRKAGVGSGSNAKKLKIWMGKRKVGESDDDDSGDDTSEDAEDEKSTISDGAMQLNQIKEVDGSSDSVTGGRQDGEAYTSSSNGSGSEEEKEGGMQVCSESNGCSGGGIVPEEKSALVNPVSSEGCAHMSLQSAVVSETEVAELINESHHKVEPENCEVLVSRSPSAPDSGNEVTTEAVQGPPEAGGFSEDKVAVVEEAASVEANVPEDTALDFDKFNSAAEMEVLGMERLKLELQSRGLKCGGTLQERASRLFLLKTTPLDKIPKKHLAKK